VTFSTIGVSNIAWPAEHLPRAIELVQAGGLTSIEIAPFSVFRRWAVNDDEILELRAQIEEAGLFCSAIQGITFGVPNAELFASAASRQALLQHLRGVAHIAERLGARACVFGAPKQRDPLGMDAGRAWEIGTSFFRVVAPFFADIGSAIAFEANARAYGCRFVTTTSEAIQFVRAVDHPGVRLQIDTGTIFLEKEEPCVLRAAAALAVHAHVSEAGLEPIGTTGADHAAVARAFAASGYAKSLSIEMKKVVDWEVKLKDAIRFTRETYS
jgi:D-psicose/D-tagatose/L-ribulose 3-epimerase